MFQRSRLPWEYSKVRCDCVAMISGFPGLTQASAFNVCVLSLELLVMAFGTGWAFRMSSEQNNILFSF